MAGGEKAIASTLLSMSRQRAQQISTATSAAVSSARTDGAASSYSAQRDSATWKFRETRGRNGSGNVAEFAQGRRKAEAAAASASSTDMKAGAISVAGNSVAGLSATALFRRQRATAVMSGVSSAEPLAEAPSSASSLNASAAKGSVFAHQSAASLWRRERGGSTGKIPNPSNISIGISAEERLAGEAAVLASMGGRVSKKTAASLAEETSANSSGAAGNGVAMPAALLAVVGIIYTYFQQPVAASGAAGTAKMNANAPKAIARPKSNNPEVVYAIRPPAAAAAAPAAAATIISPREADRNEAMSKQPLWLQRRRE
jgi:hypothetical protein